MSKFFCNVCENEVELKEGVCPNCKTNWNEIASKAVLDKPLVKKNLSYEELIEEDDMRITDKDIKNNVNFFLNWGYAGKIIFYVLAIISFICALFLISKISGYSLVLLLQAIIFAILGPVFENILKWKAYMLHTNMKKGKK